MNKYLRVSVSGSASVVLIVGLLVPQKVSADPAKDEVKRLQEEIHRLESELAKFNERIREQERCLAVLDKAIKRHAEMEKTLSELEKTIAETLSVIRTGKSPNDNFPKEKVNGEIKVLKDNGGNITISVGSEAGLKQGHTLTVYRLKPEPEYLGEVQIERVGAKESTARLTRKRKNTTLRVGDFVTSSLTD